MIRFKSIYQFFFVCLLSTLVIFPLKISAYASTFGYYKKYFSSASSHGEIMFVKADELECSLIPSAFVCFDDLEIITAGW